MLGAGTRAALIETAIRGEDDLVDGDEDGVPDCDCPDSDSDGTDDCNDDCDDHERNVLGHSNCRDNTVK